MKVFFFIIINLLIFVGFLTIFILSISICSKFNGVHSDYTIALSKNWFNSPIIDIKTGPFCPTYYTAVQFDPYQGSMAGCLDGGYIYTGSCTSNNITDGHEIYPISEIPISKWYNNILCIKRLSFNSTYFDLQIVGQNQICDYNQKHCGVIDSIGNILCISSTSDCPINDILMLSESDSIPSGYQTVSLVRNGAKKILAFSNKNITNGKIVVEFKISDNIPCINPYFYNKLYNPYILDNISGRDKCIGSYGGQFIDKNYKYIDFTTIHDLYQDNLILDSLKNLPDYPVKTLNLFSKLYYRNYIGLNTTLFNSLKFKNIIPNITNGMDFYLNNFKDYNNFAQSISIFTIVIFIVIVIFYTLSRTWCIGSDNKTIIIVFLDIIMSIIILIVMILNIYCNKNIKNLENINSSFLEFLNYGDLSFQDAINSYILNIKEVKNLVSINIILSAIMIPLPLILLSTFCC